MTDWTISPQNGAPTCDRGTAASSTFTDDIALRAQRKGEAADLIDDSMACHPEKEEQYQRWKEAEEDFEFWFYQALESDFCQEGDMHKPTKDMIRDTMKGLDATQPTWRREMGGNVFSLVLMKRYPQLEKRRSSIDHPIS
jgi:hypothetical protein